MNGFRGRGGMHRAARAEFSNKRNSRNVWTIATEAFSEAHFATFPTELARRCILAGTSSKGVCSECGAPYERETDVTYEPDKSGGRRGKVSDGHDKRGHHNEGVGPRLSKITTTTGWQPSCQCDELRCSQCSFVLDHNDASKIPSTTRSVSDMQSDVPPLQKGGEVLFQGVLPETGQEIDADNLHSMRADIHTQEQRAEALLETVRPEVDSEEQVNQQGLDDNVEGLQDDSQTGSSECSDVRLCDGTSSSHGDDARSISDRGRGCSPQKRRAAGQSSRQSGTDDEAPARRRAKASLSCDLSALQQDISSKGQCPHCGSCLERVAPAPVPATVLDCFGGAGTTALVADRLQRNAILIELNAEYAAMAQRRIDGDRGGLLDLMDANKPLESAGFGTLY